ncbi:MAG: alpha/beta fold hydrolase [Rhodopila sp.]
MTWDDFRTIEVRTGQTSIFLRWSGTGAPVLLLHGFPETHLMWRDIAPRLAERFSVVCADLRGYGRSGCPPSTPDHAPYSKRAMAQDMAAVMAQLGFPRFAVAGHDRGGRVAYRLALDHPDRVTHLAVLDVLPVAEVWDRADARLATAFWPWSLLAQDPPLPERLISAAPDAVIDNALGGWGSSGTVFEAHVRDAYIEALRDPSRVHAICEEYRAAATLDRRHDDEDRAISRRIRCPVLALWSAGGPLDTWYAPDGGPLAIWKTWASNVRGHPVAGGHFFPEEQPEQTAALLARFFPDERD